MGLRTANCRIIILRCVFSIGCLLFFAGIAGAEPAKELPEPVYKGMRPKITPFDSAKIPDPFLSYLVKRGHEASTKTDEDTKKKLEAEERLKQQKLTAAEKLKSLKVARTELQQMALSQLTLTAIIQAGDTGWAMVRDPKGRGFVLKKGTPIGRNGGVVFKVASKEKKVIIKEPYLEDGLRIKYKNVEMKLPDQVYE
ncbi:MAG: pilus assembly protein PilP [Proteobacteria bacterium]|nr:pilus assembly protein PilP [Pseudomonadota bacterium]